MKGKNLVENRLCYLQIHHHLSLDIVLNHEETDQLNHELNQHLNHSKKFQFDILSIVIILVDTISTSLRIHVLFVALSLRLMSVNLIFQKIDYYLFR